METDDRTTEIHHFQMLMKDEEMKMLKYKVNSQNNGNLTVVCMSDHCLSDAETADRACRLGAMLCPRYGRTQHDTDHFRRDLKTYLFNQAFS